jgi:Amt family ammonium transporter
MNKKWDAGFITNGFLAGLVALRAPCYWVSPLGSIILGGVAGGIVILATESWSTSGSTIPVGAWPCTACAASGERCRSGLFACGKYHPVGSSATGVPMPDAA